MNKHFTTIVFIFISVYHSVQGNTIRQMNVKKLAVSAITGILLITGSSFRTYQSSEKEYQSKAAFLYHFVDYVEWKSDGDNDFFNIAILGESDIAMPLMQISDDKRIGTKKIRIKQYASVNDIEPSQIIFVSMNYNSSLDPLIAKFCYQPTLIITERNIDFIQGSHINFFIAENRLKFEVNLKSVSNSGLKISSQLLQHAVVIKP